MKRGWFLLLALSIGLNGGLLYVTWTGQPADSSHPRPPHRPGLGPARGGGALPAEKGPSAAVPRGAPAGTRALDPERLIRDHLARLERQIDLSEEQRERLEGVLTAHLPLVLAQRQVVGRARDELAGLYRLPQLDPQAYRAAAGCVHREQARLDSLVTEAMLAEALCFTEEQREHYVHMMPWNPPPPGARPHPGGPPVDRRRDHRPPKGR